MPLVADITKIDAPLSALAGEQVIVDVSIKNISNSNKDIGVAAVFDSTSIPFQFGASPNENYLIVLPGQTVIMRGWFTMPSKAVRITAGSFYWSGSSWVLDETVYADISLAAFVSEFSGLSILSLS